MSKLFVPLFIILSLAGRLQAQTTVSLGLPTSGAGSTNVLLSTSTTGNTHSQTISIYTAAEIIAGGGAAGNITALAWDKQGTGEYTHGNAEMYVYLKHVNYATWGATGPDFNIEVTTATQVFGSTTYSLPTGTGWAPVTFATPFTWNGTDNIAVFVSWYRPSTPSAAINWGRSVVTSANATRVNTSFAALIPLFVNNNRPVVQLVFSGASSCPVPTGLAATGVTATGATLNWGAVTGATGYEYAFSTNAAPPASGTAIAATTHNPGTLTPSTTYYMHVRAQCGASNFSGWTTISFTTPALPCAPPTSLTVGTISSSSGIANWGGVTGATGYEYDVSTNSTPPVSGTAVAGTTQTLSPLTAATLYYVHVRAQCGPGNFSPWSTATFTTSSSSCVMPAPVVTNITSVSADINWPAVTGGTSYEYDVSTTMAPPASGTGTTATSHNPISLTPATTYYAHIRTICPGSQVSSWAIVSFTTLAPCSAPSPSATGITDNSVDIAWPVVAGATGYEFAVNTNATPPVTGTPTALHNQTVGSLTAGTNYHLHVRTDCGSGNFSQWVSIPFTTLAACNAPVVAIANVSESTADITWGAVTGATGYEYAVNNSATPPAGAGTSTTALAYNAGGLTPVTAYYVHLRSVCNTLQSAWATTSFITQFPAGINNVGERDKVKVYPNPANGYITIETDSQITEIRLFSTMGALIATQPANSTKATFDVSEYAPGIYHIRLQTEKGSLNRQISITR